MAEIKNFLSPEAIKQQDDYIKKLEIIKAGYEATAKSSMQLLTNIEKINVTNKNIDQSQTKLNKTNSEASKIQKQLEANNEKLRIVQDARYKQIVETQRQTANQRKETNLLVRAQQAERGSIEQLSAVNAILEKRLKGINIQTEEGRKRAERLRGAIDRNTKTIMANSSQYSRWKINVGNYQSALSGLSPTFGRVSMAANQASKAFKLLLANPVVLVISAIVAAFAGLVAIFKSTDDGGTKLQGVFDGIKNVLGVLKNVLSQVLEALKSIRDGKFKEAFTQLGEATQFAKDNMVLAYQAGYQYAQSLDAVNDRITANISGQAETLRQFREYISLSKDQTLSDRERIRNLDLAQKAAEEYYGTQREDAKELFDLEIQNLASRTRLTEEQLSEFIAMDGKRAEEARRNNANIANAWNILGDENIKTLEEMYAKSLEADTQYFKRTSEITSLRTGLIKKQNNEILAEEQRKQKAIIDALNIGLEAERVKIDEELDLDEELLDEKEDNLSEEIQANIDANNKIIEDAKRRKEIEKGLEKDLADTKKQFALDAVNSIFDINQTANEKKIDQLEEEKEQLLSNESLTNEQRKAIEEDYAKKQEEIRDRQKTADKIQSAIDVGIKTAQSIFEIKAAAAVLLSNPLTAALAPIALAQIPFVLGSSALALASIAAFEKGTDNAPKTGLFGESGAELMRTKKGDYYYADRPTVFSGSQFEHAKIWNAKETSDILSDGIVKGRNIDELINVSLAKGYNRGFDQIAKGQEKGFKQVVRAVKDGNRTRSYKNTLETRSGNTIKRYHNQFN